MKKIIIAAILAVVAGIVLTAGIILNKEDPVLEITTFTESTTEEIATTEPVTETTTEMTTEPTTVTTTEAPTTTKKETITKKETTTKKVTTTRQETTTQKTRDDLIAKTSTSTVALKYGVIRTQTLTQYYEKLEDGSEILVDEEVRSEVFNRIGYYASYTELLPSAKENSKTYRDYIEKILEITNGFRAEGGIEPLELDDKLIEIASVRAEELAWSAVYSHTRPNMRSFSSVFKDGGLTTGAVGENIGWGFGTPEEVCQAWRESETHYENIMNPKFTKVGFGVAADPDKDAKFCWVQHFWDGKTE